MINNTYKDETIKAAVEKVADELKNLDTKDSKAGAVAEHVADTLKNFCEQELEFAEAITQSDKTLSQCCEEIMKGVGNSISDIEVYRRAVNFYFPGAGIDVVMTVNMTASVDGGGTTPSKDMSFSLLDALDL